MTEIPTIDWRPAGVWKIIDFIQIHNPIIGDRFKALDADDNDQFVKNVAIHIRDNFIYPLSLITKSPAPEMQMLHGSKSPGMWYFKRCIYYSWLFPTEVEKSTKEGICVDTTNLSLSILRSKKIRAWAVLGTVNRTLGDEVLGWHAWCETPYKGSKHVLETTIHTKGVNNLIPADTIYNKKMDIYYVPMARYNEKTYKEEEGVMTGLVRFMGTDDRDKKKWKKQEKIKQKTIWTCFSDLEVA